MFTIFPVWKQNKINKKMLNPEDLTTVIFMHYLNLGFDDLVKVTTACLCKDLKVLYLQTNAKLAQKEEHQTWNTEVLSSILTGGNIL